MRGVYGEWEGFSVSGWGLGSVHIKILEQRIFLWNSSVIRCDFIDNIVELIIDQH